MPKMIISNPDLINSFTRPVTYEIIRDVAKWTGLDSETLNIQFPGDEVNVVMQPGSGITPIENPNTFNTTSQFRISIEEEYDDLELNQIVLQEDNPHIFYDGDSRVYVKPTYAPMQLKISIGNRFKDRTAAKRWRDLMRTKMAMNWESRNHRASYHYNIPPEIIAALKQFNIMREAVQPYGETFAQYIANHSTTKTTIISNLNGAQTQYAVAETIGRFLGTFDFDVAPEKGEVEDGSSAWTISFTYTVHLRKPIGCVLEYPLVISNQMVPTEYIQYPVRPIEEQYKVSRSLYGSALGYFEDDELVKDAGVDGVSIPYYDEFYPAMKTIPDVTTRVYTCLCNIDTTTPKFLMNLGEIGDYDIDSDILTYMKSEYQYLTTLHNSALNVMVFKGFYPMMDGSYTVDSDLNVNLVDDPDLRSTYHVRLSVYNNPILLSDNAKVRMRKNCSAAQKLLLYAYPGLDTLGYLPVCMLNNYMAKSDFDKAAFKIDSKNKGMYNGEIKSLKTVQFLSIKTIARKD